MDKMQQLLQEFDAARDELWALVDPLAPDFEIYPGWTKRELYAHMGGWDAIVFDAFRSYATGAPQRAFPYTGADDANSTFMRVRESLTIEDAKLEAEINRFASKVFLEAIPQERSGDLVTFPWGKESVVDWLKGAIKHERDHAQDVRDVLER